MANKRAKLAGLLVQNPDINEQVAVNNAVLGGLLGIGDEPSAMYPRAVQARKLADLGGIVSQAIPGEAIAGLAGKGVSSIGGLLGAGMIKGPLGRIPQTSSEAMSLAEMLVRSGRGKGYDVLLESSKVSPSQYVTFIGPHGERQIRISNHADKYPELARGVRTSVDPTTEVTFEQAVNWLGKEGFPTPLSKKYKTIPSWSEYYAAEEAARNDINAKLQSHISAWLNKPKSTRGPAPTIADVEGFERALAEWRSVPIDQRGPAPRIDNYK